MLNQLLLNQRNTVNVNNEMRNILQQVLIMGGFPPGGFGPMDGDDDDGDGGGGRRQRRRVGGQAALTYPAVAGPGAGPPPAGAVGVPPPAMPQARRSKMFG